MQLSKSGLSIVQVLLVCLALAVALVLFNGFTAVMFILWVMCVILCSFFQAALWKVINAKGFILSYFVHHGAKNNLSPIEVYTRGRNVASVFLFIIPLLYFMAR